ncbi:MAG TPA: FAD-dependent oxidoreductase [Planctomycetota bacterium]|nr:FAD-dependent oxidoreductase [Planctomycetota bacterium]
MIDPNEARKLPVAHEVDVLVVGGGPAGVAAAFAAARRGARTLVVEQFNCLGGVATAGGHGHICLYSVWGGGARVVGGVPYEMARRTAEAGYGAVTSSAADFEVEGMKLVLEQMAGECGCRLLYHTMFAETLVEDGRAVGAVVQNKGGRQRILARQVIDCTGDGDVAASAGCAFEVGDAETGLCQPVTLMFTIGGVDWGRVKAARTSYELADVWKRAQERGDMRPFQTKIMGFWWTPTRPDQVGINFTHINNVDATRAEDLTAATVEGRRQAYESIAVFRKYVPGMEQCYMVSTPNTVGIRESRRVAGEYRLTREDVMAGRSFEDSIGWGSFFIDIHNTKGPGMDDKVWRPPQGFKYQIPYRIIVPKGVENLLVAGRCASCDHEALGSLRVMPQCGVMGEAAGVAAAMALKDGTSPRGIDVGRLQDELRGQGAIVDERGIVA